MDLTTKYLGLELKNPVVVSSSRITNSVNNIKKCADHGAGAVVLKSIFEEQIVAEIEAKLDDSMYFWYPEAAEHVKSISKDHSVSKYIKLIEEAKNAVDIPVIASVNCVSGQDWTTFAKKIEEAGADAIELNIAIVPYDEDADCKLVASTYEGIVKAVRKNVNIPVAVKIGPY